MGMSASQARFLSLTARKTNTEYEGQQINQQRTALSNESSNYYSQLTSMTVPTPPSSSDYTKVTYTFKNGTENNTITSLVAVQETATTGVYKLNYTQEIPADTIVVNGSSQVTRTPSDGPEGTVFEYYIGADKLDKAYSTEFIDDEGKEIPDKDIDETTIENIRTHLKMSIPEEVVNAMTNSEVIRKAKVEAQYTNIALEKYGNSEFKVMYRKSADNSSWEPIYFNTDELARFDYNQKTGLSLGGLKIYEFGQENQVKEYKNQHAKIEQDSTGRYISMFLYDNYETDKVSGTKYELTTTTVADEAGYNDAMNQYYFDKAIYDQKVQEVNAKIEIIQVQDKNLELKLKQLDTEQNAISTEMDAVKKVISKNVESSFTHNKCVYRVLFEKRSGSYTGIKEQDYCKQRKKECILHSRVQ